MTVIAPSSSHRFIRGNLRRRRTRRRSLFASVAGLEDRGLEPFQQIPVGNRPRRERDRGAQRCGAPLLLVNVPDFSNAFAAGRHMWIPARSTRRRSTTIVGNFGSSRSAPALPPISRRSTIHSPASRQALAGALPRAAPMQPRDERLEAEVDEPLRFGQGSPVCNNLVGGADLREYDARLRADGLCEVEERLPSSLVRNGEAITNIPSPAFALSHFPASPTPTA